MKAFSSETMVTVGKATVIGTHSGGMGSGDRIIAVLNDYPDVYVRVECRSSTSDGYIAVERECRALDQVKPYIGSKEIEFLVSDEYLPAFEAVIKEKTRSDLIADTDQGIRALVFHSMGGLR